MDAHALKPFTPNQTRRQFLGAAASVAASALPTGQTEPGQPILDLHQHTKYSGRSDQELVAHQAYHHVTTTVLLAGEGWTGCSPSWATTPVARPSSSNTRTSFCALRAATPPSQGRRTSSEAIFAAARWGSAN